MSLQTVYYIVIALLIFVGYICLFQTRAVFAEYKIAVKKNRFRQLQQYMQETIHNQDLDDIFRASGVPITSFIYQTGRLLFIALGSILILILLEPGKIPWANLALLIGFVLLTEPKFTIFGRRTPFKIVMDKLTENYKYKKNLELYQCISQLKNLASIQQKKPPSSLAIIEQLSKFARLTRPAFNQMISLWQTNEKDEAVKQFKEAIGTKEGEHVANIILRLDELKPYELKGQLILFQEELKRQRETEKLRKNQQKSYVIYSLVTATIFVILTNFLVVGVMISYLMETSKID